ncbi:metal ABC transporter ATP-binding protein [Haloactinomyces albus]|uniref:Zinc transport system ATP-binding protein n=1 Tax=Haloactinomyces albus TaxID=1352928 RepID=A0AAE3ZG92_9ACTN|nr:ABC transporter ATP-binding protein [Haloactinomyces albus]MDR7303215.1 zinc transport system ATP-binding protein [Haloactinomyces albus]
MSTAEPAAALVLEGVSVAYGTTPALRDVDLHLRAGELVALVGPNGGGKSTLLKVVAGLLSPSQGSVRIDGQPPRHRRHRIGYLPQTELFDPSFPASVCDVVAMGRLRSSWRPQWLRRSDRVAVEAALARVGMRGLARRPIGQLSGGQRQRTLLARALVADPDLLILDEPEAGLDPESTAGLYELLSSLAGQATILVASHHVDTVAAQALRILRVDQCLSASTNDADQSTSSDPEALTSRERGTIHEHSNARFTP